MASITTTTLLDDVVLLEDAPPVESNDISFWEFVNQSDVDSDGESLFEENGFVSWYSVGEISSPKSLIGFYEKGCNFIVGCDEIDVNSIGVGPNRGEINGLNVKFEPSGDQESYDGTEIDVNSTGFESNCGETNTTDMNIESFGDHGCYDDQLDMNSIGIVPNNGRTHGIHDVKVESFDDDDDHDDDDGYGLDDELVPWNVSGRLERQRMRKLGKRVFAKMSNSKRNPYRFVKAGCVHGKHGLGIKAA